MDYIYIANGNVVEFTDLKNKLTGIKLTVAAVVTMSLYDDADVLVAGQTFPATLAHQGTDGNFAATLEETLSITASGKYKLLVNATEAGQPVGKWTRNLIGRVRSA